MKHRECFSRNRSESELLPVCRNQLPLRPGPARANSSRGRRSAWCRLCPTYRQSVGLCRSNLLRIGGRTRGRERDPTTQNVIRTTGPDENHPNGPFLDSTGAGQLSGPFSVMKKVGKIAENHWREEKMTVGSDKNREIKSERIL